MREPTPSHRIVAGARSSPVVLHVPHASRVIPPSVRAHILLGDNDLDEELDHLTDAHTDVIATRAATMADRAPWMFVHGVSRLVVDPERFPDAREPMRAAGMGAVYTHTSQRAPLRAADPIHEAELLAGYFHPYARGMADLVDERLAATGRAVIVDVHSYPSRPLPYELSGDSPRPAVCLGTDPAHTPPWLIEAAEVAFAGCGTLARNTPFAGCYVPLRHYGRDSRVAALMLEIRRDGYLVEPGGPLTDGVEPLVRALARLVNDVDTRLAGTLTADTLREATR